MIKKFTYGEPVFVDPVSGSLPRYFRPRGPGAYTITVEARDSANNRSSRSITVRAVLAGQTLSGVDGPPTVDEVIPADGAREIMVTMPVMVTFNEPVEPASVNADTLKLLDHGPADSPTILFGTPVPASIYLSTEGGRMKATLQPVSNLMFGHRYEVVVNDVPEDQRIMDAIDNPSVCPEGTTPPPQGCRLPMTQVYRAVFETKVPQVYDLVYGSSQQPIVGGYSGDIALYTDVASGRTYAYATSGYYGWFVADVTDPTQPFPTFSLGASPFNYRNVAVEPQRKILAMTDSITQSSITGYVRFYDLSTEPGTPTWIGQTKLAEGSSGVPTKVALSGNYAYVSTVMIGLQVVDIDSATTPVDAVGSGTSWQSGDDVLQQQDSKRSIVGTFDTIGLGFKQPRDIALYQPGRALLSTTSGYLLVLDVNTPQPQLINALKPADFGPNDVFAWAMDAAAGYSPGGCASCGWTAFATRSSPSRCWRPCCRPSVPPGSPISRTSGPSPKRSPRSCGRSAPRPAARLKPRRGPSSNQSP